MRTRESPSDDAQQYGAQRLSALLANSAARFIGISYGMNDAGAGLPTDYSFYNAYKALVDTVLAAGRIPVIPTISWTAQQPWQTAIGDPVTGPQFCLNRQLAKLKADYRAQGKTIIDGPDLWQFFKANPSLIGKGDNPSDRGWVRRDAEPMGAGDGLGRLSALILSAEFLTTLAPATCRTRWP